MAYIGREPTFGAFETQDFVGTGSQTDFTLDFVVSTASSLAIWVNNVSQVPNTQFNTIGNILRFVTAPVNSATIKVVYLGRQHLVPTVADGSVNEAKITNGAVTTDKIASNAVDSTKIDILKDTPNASSIYEIIDSTDKGVLFAPKITEAQRDAISGPATGLVLYNTDKNKLNIYNGSKWENLGGGDEISVTNAADIFTNFVKDMEDHGRTSLHTEAGFVDELEASNDMIDESNSSGFGYDATGDFYSNIQVNQTSSIDFTTETNYIQQEWTNSNQSTSQATVASGTTVTLSSGTWPTNCDNGRISFDSGSTWFDILSRDSNTQVTLDSAATNGTFDYIIRLSEFDSGSVKLNDFNVTATDITSGQTYFSSETEDNNTLNAGGFDDTANPSINHHIWLTNGTAGGISPSGSNPSVHLGVQFSSAKTVVKYTIVGWVNFTGRTSGEAPKTWTFEGSNNGTNYTTLDTQTNVSAWSSGEKREYTINNTTAYLFYRIVITEKDGTGGSSRECIAEMEMLEASGPNNPINEYTSIVTSESHNSNISIWTDINSASITETGSGDAHYWLGFDPASGYGPGTEAKIFHQGDSVWRTIAKNNAGTWEYNNFEVDKTELLLNANGSDGATSMTVEGSIGGAFTFFGNAQLDTTVKKFGTSSIQFDGNEDYVQSTTSNSAFALGTDDFTVDYWINWTTVASGKGVWALGGPSGGGHLYYQVEGGSAPIGAIIYVYFSHPTLSNWTAISQLNLPGGSPTPGQWYHHAFVKQGTTLSFYEDGVPGGTYTIPVNNGDLGSFTESKWRLGGRPLNDTGSTGFFDGHIDSFRVTRKVLWTSPFNSSLLTEPTIVSGGGETYTGTSSSTNDMLHAVSQAVSTVSDNRMSKADIEAISDAEFEATDGFNSSTHTSLFRGVTLNSTNVTNNISVDSYGLNYDFNGAIDLRTKQWTGTNGTPSAPSTSPETIYLFVVDEQTSGTPQYQVTRDGSTYINVTFDRDWVFSGTKRARRATIDVSSQPAGTDPRVKITTLASDDFKLHAVGLQTKS